jgi:hypothetical protein
MKIRKLTIEDHERFAVWLRIMGDRIEESGERTELLDLVSRLKKLLGDLLLEEIGYVKLREEK